MSGSTSYQQEFAETAFQKKLAAFATTAGSEVVEKALWLYLAARRPETPIWARSASVGALGYFHFAAGCHSRCSTPYRLRR